MKQIYLKISAATRNKDGRKNQDNMLVDKYIINVRNIPVFSSALETDIKEPMVFCVADGIGGQQGGDIAAEKAVISVYENLRVLKFDKRKQAILGCLDIINSEVVECMDDEGYNSGTTLSGIIIDTEQVWIWNIGDSPIYLLRKGMLKEISEEHTLANEKNKINIFRKDTYESNVLTKYIGNYEESGSEQAYIDCIDLKAGDVFLICSDGIVKGLSARKIKHVLKSSGEMNYAEKMVELAEANDADDDITAIVIKVEEK